MECSPQATSTFESSTKKYIFLAYRIFSNKHKVGGSFYPTLPQFKGWGIYLSMAGCLLQGRSIQYL